MEIIEKDNVFVLKKNISYLNDILNRMKQGVLFINANGIITTANASTEKLLDIEIPEILYQKYSKHLKDDLFGFSMDCALKTGKFPHQSMVRITSLEGVQHDLEVESLFLPEYEGILVLLRDVTETCSLQMMASRRDSSHVLGEMVAMAAHEIRNPLGSIKGFASLLHRDLKDQPALQRLAKDIMKGADNLNQLVTKILNYSHPLQPNMISSNLIGLIKELCRQVEADENIDSRIQLEFHSSLTSLMLPMDGGLMKSALLNLVANAIEAMPEGGRISLEVEFEKQTESGVIKIADTGEGISQENLKKLFSPFFTTKKKGNGFGLVEVQRIIQAHQGKIEVESNVGKGTTFTIKLPLSKIQ